MNVDLSTLALETLNFLVLMGLLWRVLYRPLRRSIEARRAAIVADVDRAAAARAEAERLQASWRSREEELEAMRAEIRRDALDDAEAERARILAGAREDADAERARVAQLLEAERGAAARWVRQAVWSRGTELAGRLLRVLAPEAIDDALFQRLLEVVRERAAEVASGEVEVELTGARMAGRERIDELRRAVADALGATPRMVVREDAELLGGWTVRIEDHVFDGSLSGELEAFRDLAREMSEEAA